MIPTPDVRRRVDLLRRRAAVDDRLGVLELEAARKGISTPPEVVLEIEDLRADLRRLDTSLRELESSFAVQPDLTPAGMYDSFIELRTDVQRALSPLYNELLQIREHISQLARSRDLARGEDRVWRRRVLIWLAILTALLGFLAVRSILAVAVGG